MSKVKKAVERCRRVIYLGEMAWEKYGNKQYEKNHMASFDERDVQTLIQAAEKAEGLAELVRDNLKNLCYCETNISGHACQWCEALKSYGGADD